MKAWNTPAVEEVMISNTQHGLTGIHSDGNRAQGDSATCKNKNGEYWTVYAWHSAHPDPVTPVIPSTPDGSSNPTGSLS